MKYKILIHAAAEKQLRKLDKRYQRYVYDHLLALAENPRDHKCKKLVGAPGYRKVAWPYRILYTINDASHTVDVYCIAHRKEVYR